MDLCNYRREENMQIMSEKLFYPNVSNLGKTSSLNSGTSVNHWTDFNLYFTKYNGHENGVNRVSLHI